MSTEIKFRVCFKNSKRILYPRGKFEFVLSDPFLSPSLVLPLDSKEKDFDEDYLIQQYTGLKDKNGKEIYEGDVVKYIEKMDCHGDSQELQAEVLYESEFAAFALGKTNTWNLFSDFTIIKDSIEVIGNSFQNPELLK